MARTPGISNKIAREFRGLAVLWLEICQHPSTHLSMIGEKSPEKFGSSF
ncbi:hypothetical protein M595_3892 [Lyngbya aestuarii BL J]|uniref:Uncharacterized protein n=1 Tax=Lyngbya aestuarii BL J TaxID=1348334 RepID=U7QE50_9CYAN|nr:hypothetical protein M595_3892 [Lyngbya aestuarii BL J]